MEDSHEVLVGFSCELFFGSYGSIVFASNTDMVLILFSTRTPFLRFRRICFSAMLTGLQLLFADQGTVQEYAAKWFC